MVWGLRTVYIFRLKQMSAEVRAVAAHGRHCDGRAIDVDQSALIKYFTVISHIGIPLVMVNLKFRHTIEYGWQRKRQSLPGAERLTQG